MKYFIAFTLFFSGCATGVSEYSQGCRDGVDMSARSTGGNYIVNVDARNKACDYLDTKRKAPNKEVYGRGK